MLYHSWLLAKRQTIVLVIELAWLTALVYTTSDGARFFLVDDVLFLFGIALTAGIWFVGVVGSLLRHPSHRVRYVFSLAWPLWWVREPYVFAVALVLWFTPLAFATRLALSAPQARAVAEKVLVGEAQPEEIKGRFVGLYLPSAITRAGEAVRFTTGPCNLFDDCGFAYGPKGMPAVDGRYRNYHLWGPWWQWYRHF